MSLAPSVSLKPLARLCGEVEIGRGRLFACLHEQKPALSAECLEVIENVQLPRDRAAALRQLATQ